MGFKTYRMSIAWTRIFPNGDEETPNEKGLQFYENVFKECRKYGIEPLVTITHFDFPIYLIKKYGGWRNRKIIDFYKKLCEVIFRRYKGLVKYWLTFNEININCGDARSQTTTGREPSAVYPLELSARYDKQPKGAPPLLPPTVRPT